ncbi:BgTH12-02451 [Blumeria graminis f. sp. triticale]|nr:BgTH12-02451 [Blumeria graminis f. sp. triticale]
MVAHEP